MVTGMLVMSDTDKQSTAMLICALFLLDPVFWTMLNLNVCIYGFVSQILKNLPGALPGGHLLHSRMGCETRNKTMSL